MSEILIRKRKFRADMTTNSVDASELELQDLSTRNISPSTKMYFNTMIQGFEGLEAIDKAEHPALHSAQMASMLRFESLLECQLAKEEKYQGVLVEFRKLVSHGMNKQISFNILCKSEANNYIGILLRYGDYYADNLNLLRLKAKEIAAPAKSIIINMTWKEIWGKVLLEDTAFQSWLDNMDNQQPPLMPMRDLLREVAELCNMSLLQARFQLEQYVKRCSIAHSGVGDDIKSHRLIKVAQYIIHDRDALEKGILVAEMAHLKGQMLEVLDIVQNRFFDEIETEIDEDTGSRVATSFEVSSCYKVEKAKRKAALEKQELKSKKLKECWEIHNIARNNEVPHLADARNALIQAGIQLKEKEGEYNKANSEKTEAEDEFRAKAKGFQDLL